MKYSNEIVDKIIKLYEEGIVIKDICKKVGITEETFHCWQRSKTEFSELLKKADAKRQNLLTDNVTHSAYKSAIGYEVDEVTKIEKWNEDTKTYIVTETKTVRKHIQPNPTGYIFYLCNREPDKWQSINKEKTAFNDSELINDLHKIISEHKFK